MYEAERILQRHGASHGLLLLVLCIVHRLPCIFCTISRTPIGRQRRWPSAQTPAAREEKYGTQRM